MKGAVHDSSAFYTLFPNENTRNVRVIVLEESSALTQIDAAKDAAILITVPARVHGDVQILIDGKEAIECFIAVDVHAEASVNVVTLETSSSETLTIKQRSRLGSGASIHWHNVSLGYAQLAHDLVSTLEGDHATSTIDWIFYAKGEEMQSLDVCNVFNALAGGGEITIKGVAEGKAHVKCLGLIEIGPGGGGTDTYLMEDVLMLDKTAKVDAIPALEIKTNDVKASHSATVSRVTEEDLFYFGARGIEETQARQMYVEGFLSALAERVTQAGPREQVTNAIQEKLLRT